MKNEIILFIVFLLFCSCKRDYGELKLITSLPSKLNEVSGIEVLENENEIFIIEDSNGGPILYKYDSSLKEITSELKITNAVNNDWEDLASDSAGNIYIGDFGNNNNDRKGLTIYKISKDSLDNKDATYAEIIDFYYPDQEHFPPKYTERNYDVEAFICFNDFFYLFTRNRSSNFNGLVKIYKVPIKKGRHQAVLYDSFITCTQSSACQITSADVNYNQNKIALLSYKYIWIIDEFNEDHFSSGRIIKSSIHHRTQKESITFKNDTELYIADELSGFEGGNLYEIAVPELTE